MLLLAGAAASVVVVPRIIRAAWEGRSLSVFNALITGQDHVPLERYLDLWTGMWLRAALVFVVGAAAVYLLIRLRRRLRSFAQDVWRAVPATPPRLLPVFGIALGLAAGTVEGIAVDAVRLFGTDATGDISRHVLWTAPLGGAVLFGTLGLALWPLARRWPRALSLPVLLVVLGTPAFYTPARAIGVGIMPWAAGILGLGIGVSLARAAARKPEAAAVLVKRGALVLAGWTLIAALIVNTLDPLRTALRMARLPVASDGPNIILLILDTVRAHNLSLYGYERATSPTLERIGADGVVFERAVATSSWTLPSHASMFTGRHNHELGTDWHVPLDGTHATLAETLRDAGYETASFVGNLSYTSRESGLQRGFVHSEDQPVMLAAIASHSWLLLRLVSAVREGSGNHRMLGRKRAKAVTSGFLRWLDRQRDDRPFFVFLNYFDAHDPYALPRGSKPRFAGDDARYWLGHQGMTYAADELEELRDRYDDTIVRIDAHLDTLFTELERRGVLDRSILVVTSDHGEQFGEQAPDVMMHGNTLALSTLHVPLLVRYPPAVPAGVRVTEWVSLIDLPATILELAGARPALPGASLAAWWTPGRVASHRAVLSELLLGGGPMVSLIHDDLHFLANADGSESLYDVIRDPWEVEDLAGSGPAMAERAALRAMLDSLVAADQDPEVSRAAVSSSKR